VERDGASSTISAKAPSSGPSTMSGSLMTSPGSSSCRLSRPSSSRTGTSRPAIAISPKLIDSSLDRPIQSTASSYSSLRLTKVATKSRPPSAAAMLTTVGSLKMPTGRMAKMSLS
jgi:hypothetical protein